VQEEEKYHTLSLKKVLRNRKCFKSSIISSIEMTTLLNLELLSYKVLGKGFMPSGMLRGRFRLNRDFKKLRLNRDLAYRMTEFDKDFHSIEEMQRFPIYSLLGELQTYDYSNSDGILFRITRPILVIADDEDIKPILEWEEENTVYEKEVGLFFRHIRRTSSREYFALT